MELLNAKICLKLITVDPTVLTSLFSRLNKSETGLLYPFLRTQITIHTIPQGVTSHNLGYLFSGNLPGAAICAFLKDETLNAAIDKNPFNFENFGCTSFEFSKNGIPVQKHIVDFEGGDYLNCYQGRFEVFISVKLLFKNANSLF